MSVYELIIAGMLFSLVIAVTFVLFYLRYKRQLTIQQLEISQAETFHQRDLLHATIQSQEEERKRIGMNLHDEVGAALSSLRMMIETYDMKTGNSLVKCKSVIDRVMVDVRNISHDLSPIRQGAYDFADALEDRCDAINQSGELRIDLYFEENRKDLLLSDSDALAFYRVMSELLNNTIRHAKAKQVEIRFSSAPGKFIIDYHDDGIGLPETNTQKKGMGMQNIESRLSMIGATYLIDQKPVVGFSMRIELTDDSREKISE
ncbi:hypothetical protein BH11BAC7_BH11BAC7_25820 [soil metagenome]